MKRVTATVALALLVASGAIDATTQSPTQTLQTAIDLIESAGDVKRAASLLEELAKGPDRRVAARALVTLGQLRERQRSEDALSTYERVVKNFADQPEETGIARARIAALTTGVTSAGEPRIVCTGCADPYGSISPEGAHFAKVFEFLMSTGEIGLVNLATGRTTILPIEGSGKQPTGGALSPVFSPDGSQIAYAWGNPATDQFQLRVIHRQRPGTARVLVSNPEVSYIEPQAWSATGSLLVLLRRPDQTWDIGLVSPITGALTRVKSLNWRVAGSQHSSSLSPDGRLIAYSALTVNPAAPPTPQNSRNLERQIYVVAADGSGELVLTTGAGVKRGPKWTPDGSHIVYSSDVSGDVSLWAQAMSGSKPVGEPKLVRSALGSDSPVGISRGWQYFFYDARPGVLRTSVESLGVSGDTTRRAGSAPERLIGALPDWSPDGKKIAVRRGDDFVIRTLATGEERVVRRTGLLNFPPMWYGDGSALLVFCRDGGEAWCRIDATTGSVQKVVPNRADAEFRTHRTIRTLAPDGKTLYLGAYATETGNALDRVVAVDLATGVHRNVFRLPVGPEGQPQSAQELGIAASHDGRSLAVAFNDRQKGTARLAIVGVDGQGYRELVAIRNADFRYKVVWSHDGQWIYFPTIVGAEADDRFRVMRIRTSGGTPEATSVESVGLSAFDISPDGLQMAHSSFRPEGAAEFLKALDISGLMKPAKR